MPIGIVCCPCVSIRRRRLPTRVVIQKKPPSGFSRRGTFLGTEKCGTPFGCSDCIEVLQQETGAAYGSYKFSVIHWKKIMEFYGAASDDSDDKGSE